LLLVDAHLFLNRVLLGFVRISAAARFTSDTSTK
jgi:hypothetical protein